jgi:hypothetical protein
MNGTAFKTRSRLNSPDKVSFDAYELGKNFGFEGRKDSTMTVETVNHDQVLLSDTDSSEEEKYDDPDILFGHEARGKFWELFKSDRKFKDFNPKNDVSKDPRFAYFKECSQAHILPRSN